MRIIEKKCPNCGASLEFDENARSCKCEYCKRTFEIERDNHGINVDFNLSELKGPMKIFSSVFIIVFIISFIIIGSVIFLIGSAIHKSVSNQRNGGEIFKSVDQLNSEDYGALNQKAYEIIYKDGSRLDDYYLDMNVNRKKIYLAYKKGNKKEKDTNIMVAVYSARYKKRLRGENIYDVLVPIVYEDLKNDNVGGLQLAFQLDDGYVKAPEYYFNMEHSEYALGYKDLDTIEKEIIEPLKKDGFKISKK